MNRLFKFKNNVFKVKSFLKSNIICFFALTLIYCNQGSKTIEKPDKEKIEFLRVFAKVYGYVKYFHPSDEASSIDWNLLALYGAEEIDKCSSKEEVIVVLNKLFQPIAPTIKFYDKDELINYDFSKITPKNIENFELTYWQHLGVEPSREDKDAPYHSLRINRGNRKDSTKLFDDSLEFGELIEKDIGQGITCQVPLVLYANSEYTFPKSDKNSLLQLQNKLNALQPDVSELYLRLGNTINLFNVIQHFYPYMNLLDLKWEEHLKSAMLRCYEDETLADHIISLEKFTAHLKDSHISFSTKPNISLFEGSWDAYVIPLNWEWVEEKLVITDIFDEELPIKVGDIVSSINHKDPKEFFQNVYSRISAGTRGWLDYRAKTLSLLGKQGSEMILKINNYDLALTRNTNIFNSGRLLSSYHPDRLYINDSVTYINLGVLMAENFDGMLDKLKKSKSIICDLRGYPTTGIHRVITHFLKEKDTAKGYMKVPEIVYPDQENIEGYKTFELSLEPSKPYLGDKQIIFLTDGRAISYSETILIYVDGYNLATIVGQPTAGTNGNKTGTQLLGGIVFYWTGMVVTKLDGSQLHGIGVTPDIYVSKTISGVKSGKDEILEKAIQLTREKP